MSLVLLLFIGLLVSYVLVGKLPLAQRVGYSLFFSMASVPMAVFAISLFGRIYIDRTLVLIVCAIFMAPLSVYAYRIARNFQRPKVETLDAIPLFGSVAIAVFSWFYFTNAEFFLSLASYLQRGEAKCFGMQTFKLIRDLNPGAAADKIPEFFNIISTPGNALFTAPLMPILGVNTVHVVYVAFQVLLFLFSFLLLHHLTRRTWISLGVAAFAVLNPYALSVEILDRNAIAFALSAVLFFTLFAHKDKPFLHGLLFGFTAGAGLRFLPLTFAIPILLFYVWEKSKLRSYALFFLGFAIVFPINLPHLSHHGLHSLGQAVPFWKLLWLSITEFLRTPHTPYPTALFYPMNTLAHLGLIGAALILFGVLKSFAHDRRTSTLFALMFLPTYIVLAAQRDWIEVDKSRIFLTIFLPLMFFLTKGILAWLDPKKLKSSIALFTLLVAGLYAINLGMLHYDANADTGMFERKLIYQSDSTAYMSFSRAQLFSPGFFPNYHRLFNKIHLSRKRIEENAIGQTLFGPEFAGSIAKNKWVVNRVQPSLTPVKVKSLSNQFVNVQIDFDKLVTQMESAVHVSEAVPAFFADFENTKALLDIYHKQVRVSWQAEALPVTLMTGRSEFDSLLELNIELNALFSLGKDEFGFEKVNFINFHLQPGLREQGKAGAFTALPQTDDLPTIVLRIPQNMKVIVRNWIVDGIKGAPFRMDAWQITVDAKGEPHVEFYSMEPESYL